MDKRPDMHEVNDRAKLIRDRLIARRIARDPSLVTLALTRLRKAVANEPRPAWWALEWLDILERPAKDVALFIRSTDEYSRRLSNCTPFSDEVTGLGLADDERRRKLLSKAVRSVMLIPRIEHQATEYGIR